MLLDKVKLGKRYNCEIVCDLIASDTAKNQLKADGRTFRLTSGAIVNAVSKVTIGSLHTKKVKSSKLQNHVESLCMRL